MLRTQSAENSGEMWLALWDCLLASGADVSDYAYETRTREGRSAGFEAFKRRGTVAEVVQSVQELRNDYDEACEEAHAPRDRTCPFCARTIGSKPDLSWHGGAENPDA